MLFSKLFAFVFIVLNITFLANSLSAISFNFFNFTGTVFSLPTSQSSTFVFKLFKLGGTLVSLLTPSLSTSDFKSIKCV